MRHIILILTLLIVAEGFAQQTYRVQILSAVDSQPARSCQVRINKKQRLTADTSGIVSFTTKEKKVRISVESFFVQDAAEHLIDLEGQTATIHLFTSDYLNPALVKYDIDNKNLQLYCGGGFVAVANTAADKAFEKKYSIKYNILGCIIPSLTELEFYNKMVADHLDKKYGKGWREKVRPDVYYVSRKLKNNTNQQ